MIFLAVVKQIIRWVGPLFTSAGYPIIGVAVLLERSIFLGLIIPGDVILALGGVYAGRRELSLAAVIAIGTFAAITGESIGYWLGRRYGRALIKKLPLVGRLDKQFESAERYFRKRGGLTVAVGRYATAAGAFVPFVAGMSEMPYGTFLVYDVPAIAVWAAGITLVGYYFGRNLDTVERILSRFGYAMLAVLILLIVGQFVWRRLRKKPDSILANEADVHEPTEET
ncbi:MAG TPA: DedA family protein [Actinomycetota bacterium]|nr:DedA family protein [Actinomycetota bacterium]